MDAQLSLIMANMAQVYKNFAWFSIACKKFATLHERYIASHPEACLVKEPDTVKYTVTCGILLLTIALLLYIQVKEGSLVFDPFVGTGE